MSTDRKHMCGGVHDNLVALTFCATAMFSGCSAADATAKSPGPAQIILLPASVMLTPAGGQQFTTVVTDSEGNSVDLEIDFSATGGMISESGVYTAGEAPGVFMVIATVKGHELADTSEVQITESSPPIPFTPNRPAGLTTLVDIGFASPDDIFAGSKGSNSGFTDPTAPYSPDKVVRFVYPAGDGTGFFTANAKYPSPAGTQRVYIAFNWRLSDEFTLHPANLKGWYFYRQTGQTSGSLVVGWNRTSGDLTSGTFHLNGQPQTFSGPGFMGPNVDGVASLERGRWYHTEILAIMNSASNVSDGVLRVWVDGSLALDYSNVRYSEGDQPLEWRGIHLDPYYGGESPGHVIPTTSYLFVDHAIVATSQNR